uniref:Uncharacterized protein n=1 Tax=Cannabis sativa TaxID=3483 RepID=A0A803P210_CANSA
MWASTKNTSTDFLKIVVVTLILWTILASEKATTMAMEDPTEAPAEAPMQSIKEKDDYKRFEKKSKKNEYKVAMPLYRVKEKPGVLIPGSKFQASTTFFSGEQP